MVEPFELQVEPTWSRIYSFGEHHGKISLEEDIRKAPFFCDISHAEEKMSSHNSSSAIHIS